LFVDMAASAASLQFGQEFVTSTLLNGTGLATGITPDAAVLSPLSVWFALVLLLNAAGTECYTRQLRGCQQEYNNNILLLWHTGTTAAWQQAQVSGC
jgi:hypothetical protein